MKYIYVLLVLVVLFSCKKEPQNFTPVVDEFINCDASGNYKFYVDHLSPTYKNLLFKKYRTTDDEIILDSIKSFNKELRDEILKGKYSVTNTIIKTIPTDIEGVSLVKYRSSIFEYKDKSEIFREKILLKIIDSNKTLIIPYSQTYRKEIDSLITAIYSISTLNKISSIVKIKNFETNNQVLKKIEKEFKRYNNCFKAIDNNLLDFIYPPAINEICRQSGKSKLTSELKTMIIEKFRQSMKTQTLDFQNLLIEDISELNCAKYKDRYLISYVIDLNKSIYIPAQAVVIIENNKIYFIEYEKNEFETTLKTILEPSFIECVSIQSTTIKKKLALN